MCIELLCERNLPAPEEQIAQAEAQLQEGWRLSLPGPLRCLYLRHDGFQVYALDDDSSALQASFFGVSQRHQRYRWLLDPTDREDWEAHAARSPRPLVMEHEALHDELMEFCADRPRLEDWLARQLWIAADWDGSVGERYGFDLQSQHVSIVPSTRFGSHEATLAALLEPTRLSLEGLLQRMSAPEWLIDVDLYEEGTDLMFFSGSRDAKAGHGAGERLAAHHRDAGSFEGLDATDHWRRSLSNFCEAPFVLDDRRWATVEHCFQAQKFAESHPEYFRRFALDSGDPLSRATGAEARKAGGRKAMPLSQIERMRWEARKGQAMRRALQAKYEQNEEHRRILLATGCARLTHRPPRSRFVQVEYELMQVRKILKEERREP